MVNDPQCILQKIHFLCGSGVSAGGCEHSKLSLKSCGKHILSYIFDFSMPMVTDLAEMRMGTPDEILV